MNNMIKDAVHQYIMALVERWEMKYQLEHQDELNEIEGEIVSYQKELESYCQYYENDRYGSHEDVLTAATELDDLIQKQQNINRDKKQVRKLVAELLDLDKEEK